MAQPPGPYRQPPYGQAPYGEAPYGQAPHGQAPYSQPYGQYGGSAPAAPTAPSDDRPAQVDPWTGAPLPPPFVSGPVPARPIPAQRPALIGMAATLAVTASVQLIGLVSMLWLVAAPAADALGQSGAGGVMFHTLNRFSFRMVDGLAWPLYLFPVAAAVAGFLLLMRRPWARIVFSAIGVAAVVWSAWWLSTSLQWWAIPAAYVIFTCLITWTPSVSRWYAEGPPPRA